MPPAEPSVDSQSGELDDFFALAMHELKSAVRQIIADSALLDAQIADDPALETLREVVRNVRGQADLVAALVEFASPSGRAIVQSGPERG
jgi:light-regulated signal transduction histidine kinase (bacteriophytochrome)